MVEITALLVTALLFGGMVLYSFGFAAFLFTALPSDIAGKTIRRGFPLFYLFVLITAGLGAVLTWPGNQTSALLLAVVALTTIPTRQLLMPAINKATDSGAKKRFKILHTASVLITLAHMVLVAIVLARFV